LHGDVGQPSLHSRSQAHWLLSPPPFICPAQSNAQSSLYFDLLDRQDGVYARRLIEGSRSFVPRTLQRSTRRNRFAIAFANTSNDRLLCRFLIVPVRDAARELVGMFVL